MWLSRGFSVTCILSAFNGDLERSLSPPMRSLMAGASRGARHPGIEVAVPDLRELLNDNDLSVCAEGACGAREPRGQGRTAYRTEMPLGPPVIPAVSPRGS
jgi:hypothetical protein